MTNWLSFNPFGRLPNPKQPTFAQKKAELLQGLSSQGFQVVTADYRTGKLLKVPYATGLSGRFRYWFKPQAIYYTIAPAGKHQLKNARSWTEDMRKSTADGLVLGATREMYQGYAQRLAAGEDPYA